jgi:viroplasmin and RNaseH domain-containing protein
MVSGYPGATAAAMPAIESEKSAVEQSAGWLQIWDCEVKPAHSTSMAVSKGGQRKVCGPI